MIYRDINVMKRKKAGLPAYEACIKPINRASAENLEIKEKYPLSGDDKIGRGEECSIRIDDNFMSHVHSRIFKDNGIYYIEDMDSTNGTFVNGDMLSEDALELLDGDKIGIGQLEFVFLLMEDKEK